MQFLLIPEMLRWSGQQYQHVLALVCIFNVNSVEGTNALKVWVWCLCVSVLSLYLCMGQFCSFGLRNGLHMRRFAYDRV